MKTDWKSLIRICLCAFALFLCIRYWDTAIGFIGMVLGAASPLIIGAAIAFVVNILMSFYEKHYFPNTQKKFLDASRRIVCMIAAIITFIAIIALVILLIAPQLVSCIQLIIDLFPSAMKKLVGWIESLHVLPENITEVLLGVDWRSRIGEIIDMLTSGIGNVMDVVLTTVTSVFSGIVTAFLSIIFAIYLLLGKNKLCGQLSRLTKHFLHEKIYKKVEYTVSILNDCFRRYIIGQCTEAVILGVLCTIGMLILRLPYATMIGALIAFTALIPVAGAYIGAGIGAFMILMVSPVKALIFLIFILVLQQLEGNLIYPRVVGTTIGLPGLWVLAAVTVGGGILGVGGMLLAVPIAAAVYRILRNYLNSKEKKAAVITGAEDVCSEVAAKKSKK